MRGRIGERGREGRAGRKRRMRQGGEIEGEGKDGKRDGGVGKRDGDGRRSRLPFIAVFIL